ncbi:MAG: 23S rRNA (guanosine(2251)-2'-O)-methyltransferase RlmB [Proteobacteria bacterium]|nr:23S rRNA (guanosine(2251)-2'-O)-methyltransferase RlmB [Pseudomonadota bacterium]
MKKQKKHPRLTESPGKDSSEILYGVHAVKEALSAGRRTFEKIFILGENISGERSEIVDKAKMIDSPVETTSRPQLDMMTDNAVHQGVAAIVSPFPVETIDRFFLKCRSEGAPPFLLILDSIVDTHNLGALIRTSVCAGVNGIIVPKDRSARPSPAVSKASAGAMEHAMIGMATNLSKTINDLKELGVWIAGLDADADNPLYKTDLTGPIAIVVGGEEKGLRPLVKKQCDFVISIPQSGTVNSLNASVAGAVVMYEAFRQRIKDK